MPYLDHSAQVTGVVLLMIFLPGMVFGLAAIWTSYKTRMKGIDALRIYAERGEEPPASVLEALRPSPPAGALPPPRRPSRGEYLSQFATSVVLGVGSAGFAWWRWSLTQGRGDWMMLIAIVLVIVSFGAAASQLVGALTARDGD